MSGSPSIAARWSPEERAALRGLSSPERIQAFLDATPYSTEPIYRCPRRVLRDRRAHCVDGALLAACALGFHGEPPLVLDLRAVRDDDHVIALFRRRCRWGAVAKSNMAGLRYREPIHRSLRELALSYFELYYNTDGEKTLRSYSRPLDLRRLDADWEASDAAAETICARLDRARHFPLLSGAMIAALLPVDARSFEAGLLGADEAGLYAAERLQQARLRIAK
jgi:hypothetical protein